MAEECPTLIANVQGENIKLAGQVKAGKKILYWKISVLQKGESFRNYILQKHFIFV